MMTDLTHFIIECLNTNYLIKVSALTLLPVGADMNASIYKVEANDQRSYFVKLKRDHIDDAQIAVMELLQRAGIKQLIAPIKTIEGKHSYEEGSFTLIVYPFVEGQDGFSRSLSDEQWISLGRALRKVHEIDVPLPLQTRIRREDFSPKWREAVRSLYANIETAAIFDDVALEFLKFLKDNRPLIQQLVARAEELSQKACSKPLEFVLCHSDIHGGNVLLDNKDALYIVDWDDPILAPKERDLMFIGGGVGNVWNKPCEEKLFYQGYGQIDVDWTLLAYYRYERIIVDIAEYAQELLQKPSKGKDRPEMYKQFIGMFKPNGVVDIAAATAKHWQQVG